VNSPVDLLRGPVTLHRKDMPDLDDALDQIREIRAHVTRSRIYSGYRAVPTAITGALAVATAVVQPMLIHSPIDHGPTSYIALWVTCAAVSAAVVLRSMFAHPSPKALEAMIRLSWPFVAGALITLPIANIAPQLLPGLWQVFFALALFSSLPVLPRGMIPVALFYLASGVLVLGSNEPASMGIPFAIGQTTAAYVLYRHQLARSEAAASDD
jgi:hypothetical protein